MTKWAHQSEEVSLIPVPGIWISSQSVLTPPDSNIELANKVYESLQPKKYAPNNDKRCIVPVMPAVPPYVDESVIKDSHNQVEISAPLKGRKSPYSDKSSSAYRSGARACTVPCRKIPLNEKVSANDWVIATDTQNGIKYIVDFEHGNTLVRAKGCGMWTKENDLPFPAITIRKAETMHSKGEEVSDIRGVCFENTSCTELLATGEIEANLNKIGLLCANHPLGFWIYDKLQNDPAPLINKTVSLFETIGDYRFEHHVFAGLEALLSKKYDESFAQQVIDLYKPCYLTEKDLPDYHRTTCTKVSHLNYLPEMKKKIIDGSFYALDDFEFEALTDDSFRNVGIIPTHEIYEIIKDLDKGFVNLVKLYGRIGFDIGRCIGIVHRTGYLWGSYQDHDIEQYHDNAHTDNLVLVNRDLCKSRKKFQIAAPLDFDMAYKKEKSVDWWPFIKADLKREQIIDGIKAIDNIIAESKYMAKVLGGLYATFSFNNTFSPREPPPGKLYNVLWFLRDCAVYEYYQGYQKINSEGCKGNDISIDDAYDIIDEALNESFTANS